MGWGLPDADALSALCEDLTAHEIEVTPATQAELDDRRVQGMAW